MMWREVALIAGKDLRVEIRSRVVLHQIVPFVATVLLLFAFALDPDQGFLTKATPGLYWIAILLSALVVIQRTFTLEANDGGRDGLRSAGLDPAAIFLGKGAAVCAVLLGLEVLLLAAVALFYGASLRGWPLLGVTAMLATVGVVAPGMIFGVLATGQRVRETLLPLLFLPVVAPVMIGATNSFQAALRPPAQQAAAEGWRWCGLLAIFALLYTVLGLIVFGPLLEDS